METPPDSRKTLEFLGMLGPLVPPNEINYIVAFYGNNVGM